MINLPAELGWISKHLPLGPRPSGCALGPWALGQVFTDPPLLCWQVYPSLNSLNSLTSLTSLTRQLCVFLGIGATNKKLNVIKGT